MINVAKELIKGQEERKAELEKGFNVERVSLAEKLMTELKESLVVLKCEYLLDGVSETKVDNSELEAKLVKANNEIEVLKNKCKEIGPLKAQATKAVKAKEDAIKAQNELAKKLEAMTKTAATWQSKHDAIAKKLKENSANEDDNILKQAIKQKDEYIIKLESQLSDKAYQAANDGYVVDGLEVSVNIVKELNEQINTLQEELAQKEKEIEALQQAAICYETTKNNKIEKEVVNEMPKEESNNEYFTLNTNVKFSSRTSLYESNDHYVIAKPNVKDIVVVPKNFNVEVDKQDLVKYEDLLINKFGFDKDRQEISPVTVEFSNAKHKAYLARTEARESLYMFSYKDVLAGYIVNNYKVYSWSWNPETHKEPFIVDLGQKAKGRKRCEVSPCDRKALNKTIKAMMTEYNQKVKAYAEANDLYNVTKEKAIESQNKVKNRLAELFNYDKETKAIAESAQKPQTIVKDNNIEVEKKEGEKKQNNLSSSMNDFVAEMFN